MATYAFEGGGAVAISTTPPGPSLLTTGLTLNFDASVNTKLFTTFVSGGPHTGTVTDNSSVAVWQHASDATKIFKRTGAQPLPHWRVVSSLMKRPTIDFEGLGTEDSFTLTNASDVNIPLSSIFTNTTYTILISFYANVLAAPPSSGYGGDLLIGDTGGYWGIFFNTIGGVQKIEAYNYVSSAHYATINVTAGASHVVMTRHNGANLYISIDGGAETSAATGNTGSMGGIPRLGYGVYGPGRFNCSIGEIAIYNTALAGTDLSDAITYFTNKWL